MILHSSDDGYSTVYAFWLKANFPAKFNYQHYMWHTAVDDDGRYFYQGQQLEKFSGRGYEDVPTRG